jgi:F-type H+-transporting ATPase subunit b
MNDLLLQLRDLALSSAPTVLLFLATLAAYRVLVHAPLGKVLAERRARTQGAIETANAAISAAEARMQDYEQKLQAARADLFRTREERLRLLQAEMDKAIAAARQESQKQVQAACAAMQASAEVARAQMQSSIDQLGALAVARILSPAAAAVKGA